MKKRTAPWPVFVVLLLISFWFPLSAGQASAQNPPPVNWVEGPVTVTLGDDLAELTVKDGYIFAHGDDTRRLMSFMGNFPTNLEVGLLAPDVENPTWFIVFEFNPIGYVRDDDQDDLDAEAILESIKTATEEDNEKRIQQGIPIVQIKEWFEWPHYDFESHNLVWALLTDENGFEGVNYNTRLLGRRGYMSVVMVTQVATFDSVKYDLDDIIAGISFKTGNRYAEFVKGDKVAEYGLVALIAGAAATKLGFFKFLAKWAKVLVVAIAAFFAALFKGIKKFFGACTEKDETASTPVSGSPEIPKALQEQQKHQQFLQKIDKLEEEGRTEDAALLVRDKLRTQSEDLELSLKYFSLLKKSGNTLKMTAQGAPLIGLLLKEKKSKEACGVYKECVKQDPDFGLPSELNFEIAGCLLEHHQSKPALNAYIRFIKANPGHQLLADSYFQAAKLFNEVMKDPGKAHEILAMLVKKYSGHQRHPDFQKYLDEMNFVKL